MTMAMKLLYLLSALDVMNMSMFIITFAPYLRSIGGTHSQMGMIMSASALISLFWNPIAGSIGDNSGRKGILIKCLSISFLGNVLTIFFRSIPALFLFRLICSFGAPSGTLIRTIVTDVAKNPEEKANAMNKIGGVSALMFMTGALTAGFINERANGVTIAFSIISLNMIVSLAAAWFLPDGVPQQSTKQVKTSKDKNDKQDGKEKKDSKEKKDNSNQLVKAFKTLKEIDVAQYWELFTIKLFIELCYGIMQSNLGLIMATVFMVRGRNMGFVMTLVSVFSIITNFAIIRLRKTVYANDSGFTRLLHGSLMLIATFAGLGLSSYLPVFLGFVAIMSIARTLIDSTLTDVLTNQTSEKDKGGVMSLFESIMSLTGMVAPLISGVIADKYGEQTPIFLCTIPATFATVIAYKQKSKVKTE